MATCVVCNTIQEKEGNVFDRKKEMEMWHKEILVKRISNILQQCRSSTTAPDIHSQSCDLISKHAVMYGKISRASNTCYMI
jgi:hypothetical protein